MTMIITIKLITTITTTQQQYKYGTQSLVKRPWQRFEPHAMWSGNLMSYPLDHDTYTLDSESEHNLEIALGNFQIVRDGSLNQH